MNKPLSLRGSLYVRIGASFLIVALAPLLASYFLFSFQEYDNTRNVITQNMTNLIGELGDIVEAELVNSFKHVQLLADSRIIRSDDISLEQKAREMRKIYDLFDLFDDITLLDTHGVVLSSLKYDFRGDWRYKKWFRSALAGKPAVSPVHVIANPARFVVIVTVPVYDDDGSVKAVLAGRVDMGRIWTICDRVRIGESGFVFITDTSGKILAFPDKDRMLYKIAPESLRERLSAGESGTVEFMGEHKNEKICFYKTLRGSKRYAEDDWRIGVIQDRREAYAVVYRMFGQILLIAAAGIIAIVIMSYVLSAKIVRPIKSLVRATEKVARGDLVAEAGIPSEDEIGELNRAFSAMVNDLRKTTVSLDTLQKEQRRFRDVAMNTGDWVWEVDAEGRFTYASHVLEHILGYTADEVVGKRYFYDMSPADERARIKNEILALFGQRLPFKHLVKHIERKDGTEVILEISGVPIIDADGRLVGYRGVSRDITERMRAEESLKKAYGDLKQMQLQLVHSAKMAAVGTLAAGVAHEINNPLSFVMSNLYSLKGYLVKYESFVKSISAASHAIGKSEELQKLIQELDIPYILDDWPHLISQTMDGAERIKNIVEGLKSFARPDEEKRTPADIHECLNKSLELVWNEVKYKAEVVKEYGAVSPVVCNAKQISQVFMNLLINAAHAIKKYGKITIKTYERDKEAIVEITDTGHGISEKDLARVFDPFYTTKEVEKGTGLGLSISLGIIDKHGGKIDVRSVVGAGTTFRIRLPVRG